MRTYVAMLLLLAPNLSLSQFADSQREMLMLNGLLCLQWEGGRKKRERESNLCSSRKLEGNQGGREVDITKSQINLLSCPKCGRNAVLWEGRSFLPWRSFSIP